ncbi:hypothetical protein P4H32_32460 [Bacillus cereus]|nr:hypothetical protein [Bacillus cereus]
MKTKPLISNEALKAHNDRRPMPTYNEAYNKANKLGTLAERAALKQMAHFKYGVLGGHRLTRKDVSELYYGLTSEVRKNLEEAMKGVTV